VENRGRVKTSQILKWALRVSVASSAASLACSGSLGGLGDDDAGTNTPASSVAASNVSGTATTSSGGSSVASASSTGGSHAGGGSSSSSSSSAGQSPAPSSSSSTSSVSSSSTTSSSSSAVDASAALDARADAAPLSFATDVYPIIALRCTACHVAPKGSGFTQGRLDMTTGGAAGAYAQLVNVMAMGIVPGGAGVTCAASGLTRVVPGDALISLLYQKVNSKLMATIAPCGDPMPDGTTAPALTVEEVGTIQTWIDDGAKP
jgi:hypothetical protein